jgi:hypothetical protein
MIGNDVQCSQILRCTIIKKSNAGEEISIPKIKLRPQDFTDHPCEWEILQFPVRLAYAMSINKIQGQTMAKVRIWLVTAVFVRDQFHVAASITGACSYVMFAVVPYTPDDPLANV